MLKFCRLHLFNLKNNNQFWFVSKLIISQKLTLLHIAQKVSNVNLYLLSQIQYQQGRLSCFQRFNVERLQLILNIKSSFVFLRIINQGIHHNKIKYFQNNMFNDY